MDVAEPHPPQVVAVAPATHSTGQVAAQRRECLAPGCSRVVKTEDLCQTHLARARGRAASGADVTRPVRRVGRDGSVSHGYRRVVVGEDRWLANGASYVVEHRLVMSRSLARPLRSDESAG